LVKLIKETGPKIKKGGGGGGAAIEGEVYIEVARRWALEPTWT
jgi:hypothetical protein